MQIVGTISRSAVEGVPGGVNTSEVSQSLVLLENGTYKLHVYNVNKNWCEFLFSWHDSMQILKETWLVHLPFSEAVNVLEATPASTCCQLKPSLPGMNKMYCNS